MFGGHGRPAVVPAAARGGFWERSNGYLEEAFAAEFWNRYSEAAGARCARGGGSPSLLQYPLLSSQQPPRAAAEATAGRPWPPNIFIDLFPRISRGLSMALRQQSMYGSLNSNRPRVFDGFAL